MDAVLSTEFLYVTRYAPLPTSTASIHHMPCQLIFRPVRRLVFPLSTIVVGSGSRRSFASVVADSGNLSANSVSVSVSLHSLTYCNKTKKAVALAAWENVLYGFLQPIGGVYIDGDFMTRKEDLHVVKPKTTVDEALETLVENRITSFPVIDDDWKLVGLVSDYDLPALDSISGRRTDSDLFPGVDGTGKTFDEVQRLLNKTNGQVVGNIMTPTPLVTCNN